LAAAAGQAASMQPTRRRTVLPAALARRRGPRSQPQVRPAPRPEAPGGPVAQSQRTKRRAEPVAAAEPARAVRAVQAGTTAVGALEAPRASTLPPTAVPEAPVPPASPS
ncbi:MAG: hypothetical protein AAB368_13075, partial [bacterium]